MATAAYQAEQSLFADKEQLKEILEKVYAELGIEIDPHATAQAAREQMLAEGIRPEDNVFSRGIIEARGE